VAAALMLTRVPLVLAAAVLSLFVLLAPCRLLLVERSCRTQRRVLTLLVLRRIRIIRLRVMGRWMWLVLVSLTSSLLVEAVAVEAGSAEHPRQAVAARAAFYP
jgi:disulfide bond formation protein DsbB